MSSDANAIGEQSRSDGSAAASNVFVYEVLEAVGKRAFLPFLIVSALVGLTPLGTSVLIMLLAGAVIIWVGVQLLMGRETPQLPTRMIYQRIERPFSQTVASWVLEAIANYDEAATRRMSWVTSTAVAGFSYVGLICTGLALPILALMGQPVFLFCTAVLIYCVSIFSRDGRYVVAAGAVLSLASIGPVLQLAS